MPSFFYHLAFDLETELTLGLQLKNSYWDAFHVTLKTNPQHRPASKWQPGVEARRTSKAPFLPENPPDSESSSPPTVNSSLSLAINSRDSQQEITSAASVADDWRYGKVLTQEVKMAPSEDALKQDASSADGRASHSVITAPGGLATKGRFEPLSTQEEELGWGVVRLYRDREETPGLYDEPTHGKASKTSRAHLRDEPGDRPAFKEADCTTLCILAVPSYLTPADFLGFVGEKTREEVSHFRMIRTERSNRYMVLMKFRTGKKAREWRREWNGKAFDGMEVKFDIPILQCGC